MPVFRVRRGTVRQPDLVDRVRYAAGNSGLGGKVGVGSSGGAECSFRGVSSKTFDAYVGFITFLKMSKMMQY